jgi:HEAT repeat protein
MNHRLHFICSVAFLFLWASHTAAADNASYEGQPASYWIRAIGSGDEHSRLDAATALRYLGLNATGENREQLKAAVPALVAALKDPNEILRARAALALGNIDPVVAIAPMLYALTDTTSVRVSAVYALARAGPAAVPALTQALTNDDQRVRSGAAEALRDIGKEAKPTVPALKEALKDPDPGVRLSAAVALGKIEGKLPEPREYGQ